MQVYGLKTCDTCRKAMRALSDAGHAPELADVRAEGVPDAVLSEALVRFEARMLNTRSTTWRTLDPGERDKPAAEILRAHPACMKRPLIVAGNTMTVGWDAEAKATWLGSGG